MKKYIAGTIILLFVILNIFLLYKNINRQNKINELNSQIIEHEIKDYDNFVSDEIHIINSKLQLNKKLYLQVIFSDQGCPTCLTYEIPNLEHFYATYPNFVQIFLRSQRKNYWDFYNVNFSYVSIDHQQQVLETRNDFINPAIFLVDGNGTIHHIYVSEPGNREKSDRFYRRMHSLFNSISKGESEAF